MRTLAVSAVKSNNSNIHFAGKKKKSAKKKAVIYTTGTLAIAGVALALYKNKTAVKEALSEVKLSAKYMFLNTIKWLGA